MAYRYQHRAPVVPVYGSYSPEGNIPQGETQPGQMRFESRQQTRRNYGGGYGGTPEESMGAGVSSQINSLGKFALQAELINYGVTGTVRPGFAEVGTQQSQGTPRASRSAQVGTGRKTDAYLRSPQDISQGAEDARLGKRAAKKRKKKNGDQGTLFTDDDLPY